MRLCALVTLLGSAVLHAAVAWQAVSPESAGMDRAKLNALQRDLAARETRGLLIARHGRIVLEWYPDGDGPDTKFGTASLAKALVGGMSLAMAVQEKRIAFDDLASKYIPRWQSDPRKSRITIRQLATHTSGIQDANEDGVPHEKLPGWMGAFWARRPDPFSIALDQAPVIFEPGARYHYSNPGMAALAYAVTASLRNAPETDLRALLSRVYKQIGIQDQDWKIGYNGPTDLDSLQLYANWGGANFAVRATARVGQFMLQRGSWSGRQLMSRDLAEQVVSYGGMPKPDRTKDPAAPASGLAWYTNNDGNWKGVPRDAFAGAGAGQELLFVVPSLDLVVVRNGSYLSKAGADQFWTDIWQYILKPVTAAVTEPMPSPYPQSSVIHGIAFDPPQTITRKAIGSDNWPLTWAKDGDLYTSYGDGWGFEPRLKVKLSMGLAKISGNPPDIQAINRRSETAERRGDGRNGPKASGMLAVGNALYMWVRNTGNAQLAWSDDDGKTWTWGLKFESGFGSPAFLNFGPGYERARDEYVYTYSQSGPSAYETDNDVVLARAPRNRMRERDQWEFFVRAGEWTKDIEARRPVFTYPGHIQRVDAIYHPGLKRYLLTVGYNHVSGWGIFDAPEPWGPWTTAFHTEEWDLPGTHGYRLTPKWIAPGGTSGWLVFSGTGQDDAFCLRRMKLTLASPSR